MAKKPTEKQIKAEINKLYDLLKKVPMTNFFNENNHDKINAQIKVLEDRMDEDEVYAEFEDTEDPDKTYDLVSNARDAAMWLIGESEYGSPSDGWKEIAKKGK